MEHRIVGVEPDSIAEELEIEAGDVLVKVNGEDIEDVFDFRQLTEEAEVLLVVRKKDGEEWEIEIEKDEYEDLGLIFESDLMSDYRRCSNACIFCFIDQMPPNMRETLYFKDDDSRLSFLQGNYITLTNMKQKEIDRIIHHRLEPMNISVHTTDPELRCMMLKNRFAGEVLSYLDDFYNAGLYMNGQIVLCKGINDKEHLEKTLSDLYRYLPYMQSLSVVPAGTTKFRDGLYPLEPLTKEDALETIAIVEKWQKIAYDEYGIHYVHASDELYIMAGLDFPEEDRYDGYLQLENGVGMARLLFTEAENVLDETEQDGTHEKRTFATGMLAEPLLKRVAEMTERKFPGHENRVIGIENDFFGRSITVAGLVTGTDLIKQLKGKDLGSVLYLPSCMFKSGEEVFLDDLTRTDLENELHTPVVIIQGGGASLVHAMTGNLQEEDVDRTHGEYELPSLNGQIR